MFARIATVALLVFGLSAGSAFAAPMQADGVCADQSCRPVESGTQHKPEPVPYKPKPVPYKPKPVPYKPSPR